MRATILRPSDSEIMEYADPGLAGHWVERQDPLTGEIVRVWEQVKEDNPDTPENDVEVNEIWCMARGIVDGGIRAAATTESFRDIYKNIDIINMWVPKKYLITKRDRVTNIRTKDGTILWRDEEFEEDGQVRATVFNVNGVIPVLEPFNRQLDQFCLLERAEV